MKKQSKNSNNAKILRQKAEEHLKIRQMKAGLPASEADLLKLLHELEVHQIELEMQNEELTIAKEKAELAEEKYTELYDFAPIGYLTLSTTGEITKINFAAARMLDKDRLYLINQRFANFLSKDSKSAFTHFFQNVFSESGKQTCEVIVSIKENIPLYAVIDGIVNQTSDLCLLTMRNITKRRLAEIGLLESNEKIKESENNFRQLVSNIDECFWLRTDNEILYVSPGFEKIWGMPCQYLYDNPQLFTEKIHPDDKPEVLKIFQSDDFVKTGIFDFDYRIIRGDNEVRWINAKTFPIFDNTGKIIRRAGIALDITEKIQQYKELVEEKKHAEESDLLKSAFLANMSHEIRTPMSGILGFAELLKDVDLENDRQQEYIRIIEESGERMLNIINEIIDISKIESGQMRVNISEVDLNKCLEDNYNFFKPEAEKKNIELKMTKVLQNKEAVIKTDQYKLNGILTNLIKNAIKFTKHGSIEFGYVLNSSKTELEFYVKDTGAGIPIDRQTAIFDRFIQADIENKMAQQGAGLGLTISKAYVDMLDGKIWLESIVNVGTTFHFTLPYKNDTFSGMVPSESIIEKQKQVKSLKTLIVDDDEISSQLFKITVSDFSKEIISVMTGKEAINACKNNPDIDLVLMDIQLPKMNGYEATRQIREFNKEVIIIAQTAFALSGDREKSISAGCNDYISKPIKKDELKALVQRHFSNSII